MPWVANGLTASVHEELGNCFHSAAPALGLNITGILPISRRFTPQLRLGLPGPHTDSAPTISGRAGFTSTSLRRLGRLKLFGRPDTEGERKGSLFQKGGRRVFRRACSQCSVKPKSTGICGSFRPLVVFMRGVTPRAPRLRAPLLLVWGLPHRVVAPCQEPKIPRSYTRIFRRDRASGAQGLNTDCNRSRELGLSQPDEAPAARRCPLRTRRPASADCAAPPKL